MSTGKKSDGMVTPRGEEEEERRKGGKEKEGSDSLYGTVVIENQTSGGSAYVLRPEEEGEILTLDLRKREGTKIRSIPFKTRVDVKGRNRNVTLTGTVDGGAMVNAMDDQKFWAIAPELTELEPSERIFNMANGAQEHSLGRWTGEIEVGGLKVTTSLEVFKARGAFEILLGKPFLEQVRAIHKYGPDTVTLQVEGQQEELANANKTAGKQKRDTPTKREKRRGEKVAQLDRTGGKFAVLKVEEMEDEEEKESDEEEEEERGREGTRVERRKGREARKKASRKRKKTEKYNEQEKEVEILERIIGGKREEESECSEGESEESADEKEELERSTGDSEDEDEPKSEQLARLERLEERKAELQRITNQTHPKKTVEMQQIQEKPNPRAVNAFDPARVRKIMEAISIGSDLREDQRNEVEDLVKEYADVFALSLAEVRQVDFISHKLNVSEETKLPKKVHQKPLTDAQKRWYMGVLDEMEDAGIVARVAAEHVKCVSSTNLPPKDAGGGGMSLEEIIRKTNEICAEAGLPPYWEKQADQPSQPRPENTEPKTPTKPKWRICHAFMALNKATQIPPFPQGNLHMKQQRMCHEPVTWSSGPTG